MQRTLLMLIGLTIPLPAAAQEVRMMGGQIETMLSGAYVVGIGFNQRFFAPKNKKWPAGTTYDEGGNLTFGKWEVRGNRYCSVWPPNATWACYTMFKRDHDGKTDLIWVDDANRRFVGTLQ